MPAALLFISVFFFFFFFFFFFLKKWMVHSRKEVDGAEKLPCFENPGLPKYITWMRKSLNP